MTRAATSTRSCRSSSRSRTVFGTCWRGPTTPGWGRGRGWRCPEAAGDRMSLIARRPTWHYLACPICHHHRDLFCHDHGEPVKVEAVEVVPAEQLRGAVDALHYLAFGVEMLADGTVRVLPGALTHE